MSLSRLDRGTLYAILSTNKNLYLLNKYYSILAFRPGTTDFKIELYSIAKLKIKIILIIFFIIFVIFSSLYKYRYIINYI